jgi:hypothetical protein
MFDGTFSAMGGIRPAPCCEMELAAPVLGRAIRYSEGVTILPLA